MKKTAGGDGRPKICRVFAKYLTANSSRSKARDRQKLIVKMLISKLHNSFLNGIAHQFEVVVYA
jgi:hypothetical protein